MAKKLKPNTKRFSDPITIETDPKKMKTIEKNLAKLLTLDIK